MMSYLWICSLLSILMVCDCDISTNWEQRSECDVGETLECWTCTDALDDLDCASIGEWVTCNNDAAQLHENVGNQAQQLNETSFNHTQQLNETSFNHTQQLNETSFNHTQQLNETSFNHTQQLNETSFNHTQQLNETSFNHTQQLNETGFNHTQQLNETGFNHTQQLNETSFNHTQQLNETSFNHTQQLNETSFNHTQQLNETSFNHTQQLNETSFNHTQQLNETSFNHTQQLNEISFNHTQQLNEISSNDTQQLNETRSNHTQQINEAYVCFTRSYNASGRRFVNRGCEQASTCPLADSPNRCKELHNGTNGNLSFINESCKDCGWGGWFRCQSVQNESLICTEPMCESCDDDDPLNPCQTNRELSLYNCTDKETPTCGVKETYYYDNNTFKWTIGCMDRLDCYTNSYHSPNIILISPDEEALTYQLCEPPHQTCIEPPCNSNPCQHAGTCIGLGFHYSCNCTDYYAGDNCEVDLVYCSSFDQCVHGTCVNEVVGCRCDYGFTGRFCETDTVDNCISNQCRYGTCMDQPNTYTCRCFHGYTGTYCDSPMVHVEDNSHDIQISCVKNCDEKVDPNKGLMLKVTCSSCGSQRVQKASQGQGSKVQKVSRGRGSKVQKGSGGRGSGGFKYSWRIASSQGIDPLTHVSSAPLVSIPAKDLVSGAIYDVTATVSDKETGVIGSKDYIFHVYDEPVFEESSCTVLQDRITMLEEIHYECPGVNTTGQLYRFFISDSPKELGMLLYEGDEPVLSGSVLPMGNPKKDYKKYLVIRVTNELGVHIDIKKTIQVVPAHQEVMEVKRCRELDNIEPSEIIDTVAMLQDFRSNLTAETETATTAAASVSDIVSSLSFISRCHNVNETIKEMITSTIDQVAPLLFTMSTDNSNRNNRGNRKIADMQKQSMIIKKVTTIDQVYTDHDKELLQDTLTDIFDDIKTSASSDDLSATNQSIIMDTYTNILQGGANLVHSVLVAANNSEDHLNVTKAIVDQTMTIIEEGTCLLVNNIVPGETVTVETDTFNINVVRNSVIDTEENFIEQGNSSIHVNHLDSLDPYAVIDTQILYSEENMYSWDPLSTKLNTPVMGVNVKSCENGSTVSSSQGDIELNFVSNETLTLPPDLQGDAEISDYDLSAVEVIVPVSNDLNINSSDIFTSQFVVPPKMSYSLKIQVAPQIEGDDFNNTAVIILKDTPVEENDFIIEEYAADGRIVFRCSNDVTIDAVIREAHCQPDIPYEFCLLNRTQGSSKTFVSMIQSEDNIYEIANVMSQEPVKIYHTFNGTSGTIVLFGQNNRDVNSYLYSGLVFNKAIAQCQNNPVDELVEITSEDDSQVGLNVKKTSTVFGCYYWDKSLNTWSQEGCKYQPLDATSNNVSCSCTHMTVFSGGVFIAPNKINLVEDFHLLKTIIQNPVSTTVIGIVWFIYFWLFLWARRVDQNDTTKIGATYINLDKTDFPVYYVIAVMTGWKGGTTSKIQININGNHGTSEAITLYEPLKGKFLAASEEWFLISTTQNYGELDRLVVKSDCTGDYPAWYLNQMTVYDIQAKSTWHFVCNKWFTPIDPHSLTQTLKPLTKLSQSIRYQFGVKFKQGLRDQHLWMSIFTKPAHSMYSRKQRVTCALTFVFGCMLTSMMFYGMESEENQQKIVGSISFDWSQVIIGIQSVLLTTVINAVIIILFQNSSETADNVLEYDLSADNKLICEEQSKVKLSSRNIQLESFEDLYVKQPTDMTAYSDFPRERKDVECASSNPETDPQHLHNTTGSNNRKEYHEIAKHIHVEDDRVQDLFNKNNSNDDKKPTRRHKYKNMLTNFLSSRKPTFGNKRSGVELYPEDNTERNDQVIEMRDILLHTDSSEHSQYIESKGGRSRGWLLYISWFIALSFSVVASFFIIFYGLTFGYRKSIAWLVSFLTGAGESMVIVQPLKVALVTWLILLLFRKPVKPMAKKVHIVQKGKYQYNFLVYLPEKGVLESSKYKKPNVKALGKARFKVEQKLQSKKLLSYMLKHAVFMFVLFTIAYGHIHQDSFRLNKLMQDNLIYSKFKGGIQLNQVTTVESFWTYIKETYIPYTISGFDRYLLDTTNFHVTTARVRQQRIQPNLTWTFSDIPDMSRYDSIHNSDKWVPYKSNTKDNGMYREGWIGLVNPDPTLENPWTYSNPLKEERRANVQLVDVLSASGIDGFIWKIPGTVDEANDETQTLEDEHWIDHLTRHIYIELTLFNPPTELFTILSIHFEVTNEGSIKSSHYLWTCKLYNFSADNDLYTLFCEVVYIIVVLLQLKDLIQLFYQKTCQFFKNSSNIMDLTIVIGSFCGIILFILKIQYVHRAISNTGSVKDYDEILNAALIHFMLVYVLAFNLMLVCLKYVSLLELFKKIQLLMKSIRRASNFFIAYTILLLSCILAFAICTTLTLGKTYSEFSSIIKSVVTLINLLLRRMRLNGLCSIYDNSYWMCRFYFIVVIMLIYGAWIPLIQTILIRALQFTKLQGRVVRGDMDAVRLFLWDYFQGLLVCGSFPARKLYWKTVQLDQGTVNSDGTLYYSTMGIKIKEDLKSICKIASLEQSISSTKVTDDRTTDSIYQMARTEQVVDIDTIDDNKTDPSSSNCETISNIQSENSAEKWSTNDFKSVCKIASLEPPISITNITDTKAVRSNSMDEIAGSEQVEDIYDIDDDNKVVASGSKTGSIIQSEDLVENCSTSAVTGDFILNNHISGTVITEQPSLENVNK